MALSTKFGDGWMHFSIAMFSLRERHLLDECSKHSMCTLPVRDIHIYRINSLLSVNGHFEIIIFFFLKKQKGNKRKTMI
jgi:hypothetical protein